MTKLGRNDRCHCGSGKKYKKCCMDKDAAEEKNLATQNYLAPLMDSTEEDELQKTTDWELLKDIEKGFLDSFDFNDDFDEFDDGEFDNDDYPELSSEDSKLVDDWWAEYLQLKDPLAERQHLEDFIKAHPNLVLHLDLHMEVLFELGIGFLKLGKIDDHILFLMRIRNEFPDVYIQSFGYYDSDIIAWLILKNRTSEIPEYLDYFLNDPVEYVDKLFEVVQLLQAKDMPDQLLQIVEEVYKTICTSDDVMGGNEILLPLLTEKYTAYLKPGFTDEDMEKLHTEIKELTTNINFSNLEPSNLKTIFKTILKPHSKWEIPKPLTHENIMELHYDMRLNYMRFIKEKTDISWIAAHYYAMMISEYLYTWHKKTKNIKQAVWDFSAKKMGTIISDMTHSKTIFFDVIKVASLYNAIYYFADYLLQCGNIDQSQASTIQQDCIKIFGKEQVKLKKQDVKALVFEKFPEWG